MSSQPTNPVVGEMERIMEEEEQERSRNGSSSKFKNYVATRAHVQEWWEPFATAIQQGDFGNFKRLLQDQGPPTRLVLYMVRARLVWYSRDPDMLAWFVDAFFEHFPACVDSQALRALCVNDLATVEAFTKDPRFKPSPDTVAIFAHFRQ